ncbi:beta-galactosidase trimerization domain-containing protein [Sphingomonas sp. 1P08PE]|uniref:beta-galactosidase trimerization domain-containing protein n=1 Tax=Sphingomonas sp. 1P08PE TaxID=554122 RepID=UPI0039A3928E
MSGSELTGEATRRGVLQTLSFLGLGVMGGPFGSAAAQSPAAGGFDPARWWTQDYRIVQTNLREIDIRESPREIARAIRSFGGNTIVSNIGGIVAFYPTALSYQRRNPYMRGDFVAAMIAAAHYEGLAYIGRFDLSKAMKPVYDAHPDWFMLNRDGTPREFAGTYQACPNGGWAHDYGLRILSEGLGRYKPDGIFFNMTGYPRTDYANVDHGICVCANCRRGFRQMFGKELPAKEGFADPSWHDYLEFQARTSEDLRKKISAHIGALAPGIPITQHDSVEQVGRGEVQRRVDRLPPEWAYQSGDQCRSALARSPGKPWSSTSTAHIDYPWRQVTETAAYHENRFAQQMGVGAKLDLYLMGTLADQNDQSYLPPVSRLFRWRAANQASYAGMAETGRVALYQSGVTGRLAGATPYSRFQTAEFQGLYSALVDSRIPFRYANSARVVDGTTRLRDEFDVVILPNVMMMSDAEAAALDRFVAAGGLLIATGMPGGFDEAGKARTTLPLASFPLASYAAAQPISGWTLDPAKGVLPVVGRVPLDGSYFGGAARRGAETLMRFAPDQRFGPPEFSYAIPGDAARRDPGVSARAHGKGRAVHIPWLIGWHYQRDGLPVHQQVIAGLLARYAPPPRFTLAGAGPVELMAMGRADGASLLTVVNYAGQRNTLYAPPPAIHGLSIGVTGPVRASARALIAGQSVPGRTMAGGDARTWFDLPPVGAFEAVFLQP